MFVWSAFVFKERQVIAGNMMKKNYLNKKHSEFGFSLIELSIVLIIVSIGLVTALQISKIEFYENSEQQLLNSFDDLNDLFLAHYTGTDESGNDIKRLPCPARQNLAIDHPNFGKENCTNVQFADSGIPNPNTPGTNLRVLMGAVPVQSLSVNTEAAFDIYGGQYLYAVSEGLTSSSNFLLSNLSAIKRKNPSGAAIGDLLPFVIASMGETGRGAYGINGNLIEVCPASQREGKNCNNDGIFMDAFATSSSDDRAYYDGRLGFDESFFERVSNAVFIHINCPDGEFLSGYVKGTPICAPVAEISDNLGGGSGGDVTSSGYCGSDGVRIGGVCVKLGTSHSR